MKRAISRDDIMPIARYEAERRALRGQLVAMKRHRRMAIGPDCTFYFENYETMWHQVHEMLYIEKGGEAQISDELAAYNPLIPNGRELVATVMFEIDDPVRRQAFLSGLGGIEETAVLQIGNAAIAGRPEADVDRTSASGKASSVQFLHFPLTDEQAARFKAGEEQVMIGFRHPGYGHMAIMTEETRQALSQDLA